MQALTRFSDWPERLQVYLDRVREVPFKWGAHDCVSFVNAAVKATTGHDFVGEIAGTYGSKIEAARWLRANGFRTLFDAVTNKLGEPIHPAMAGRGDVVARRVGNNTALGIAVSHNWSWFVGEQTVGFDAEGIEITQQGLVPVQTLLCDRAWKIAPVVAA